MSFIKIVNIVTFYLVIAGGINWGLYGAFNVDLVSQILGQKSFASRIIFILVGVSALFMLYKHLA